MIHGTASVEFADTLALELFLVVVMAAYVREQIHGPTGNLLFDEMTSGVDRRLLDKLMHLVKHSRRTSSVLVTSVRNEDHIAFHIASGLVMLAVADFPAEVWHQQSRVENPSNSVIKRPARRERLMTTFMGQYPKSSTEASLHKSVQDPESRSCYVRGDVLRSVEGVEYVESACETENVSSNIGETSQARPHETVLRYGIVNVLDGKVWNLELVAASVNKSRLYHPDLGLVDGAEGYDGE